MNRETLPVLLVALCLALAPVPALAHKIIASIYPSGGAIEGEIGMSDGTMAAGQLVEVLGPDGSKLGETTTDAHGFFLFTPSAPVAHAFRVDLGMGHVATAVMDAAEVADILGRQAQTGGGNAAAPSETTPGAAATIAYAPAPTPATAMPAGLSDAEREAIAEIVRNETRSLRQEIAAYKEKNDLQTILGGIGYIIGLFGIGYYVAARRKLGSST